MAPMPEIANRVGEVVEAASDRFTAQCYTLYEAPPLGALVRAGEDPPVFGVVSGVVTSSLDPTRKVVARGADADSEADVYRRNPQLEHLLRTDFEALVVGHAIGGMMHQYLPSLPPRIHTFVYACSSDEVRRFAEHLDFLALLAAVRLPAIDDVVAACLRQAAQAHPDPEAFLRRASREMASLLTGDTQRLGQVLRRLT